MWQLSAGITLYAMALLELDSELPGNQLFLHLYLARNVASQTSVVMVGKKALTSMSSVCRTSLLSTFSSRASTRAAEDKQARYAVLLVRPTTASGLSGT